MAKPDWGVLQQRFLSDHAVTGVSPKEWCEAQGLNYATARRHIKKPNAQTAQKTAQKKLRTAQKEKCAVELVDDDGLTAQQRRFVAEYLKDSNATQAAIRAGYQQFVKAVRDKPELATLYGLIQASTFDNEANLPHDYIPSLMDSYPPELIKAYLRGRFTNLTSGTIYHQFDRQLNGCTDEEQAGEPLYIGMDFNVGKMAAIVHVLRDGEPRAVRELVKVYDTPAMIKRIQEEFWRYEGGRYVSSRQVYIYPDASGDSRKSNNASATDIAQLKQAGFSVVVNAANPPVKDRINSMNAMFCNGNGERRYKVNVTRCPVYTDSLEQQVWAANGEPDKSADNDHPNDAGGYYIVKQFPIIKPTGKVTKLRM